jgi:hypothetical protein
MIIAAARFCRACFAISRGNIEILLMALHCRAGNWHKTAFLKVLDGEENPRPAIATLLHPAAMASGEVFFCLG